ncbi:DUF1488 domain-containing protein [Cupriavidus basilensis]|uniref:DUF1488 domain-containing protein n=1 Tax=unclassified Cupriavidus TaxID=2640874 RepID=UPI0009E0939B|nr:DUF1488 domain-containing protein [Cupriavidus sp. SK-3]
MTIKQIIFPKASPSYCPADLSLECPVSVNGAPASYAITAEALEDHFGARSHRAEDLIQAFEGHRDDIEGVARQLFEMTAAHNIVLHSGHFRFAV